VARSGGSLRRSDTSAIGLPAQVVDATQAGSEYEPGQIPIHIASSSGLRRLVRGTRHGHYRALPSQAQHAPEDEALDHSGTVNSVLLPDPEPALLTNQMPVHFGKRLAWWAA
jgi:hypothetical protein